MKNVVFWDVVPCCSCKNSGFGGTYRLIHQGDKNRRARTTLAVPRNRRIMEKMRSSETSVVTRATWRNIPEDGILPKRECLTVQVTLCQRQEERQWLQSRKRVFNFVTSVLQFSYYRTEKWWSRKVAGSKPDGVNDVYQFTYSFRPHNPLGFTQPLRDKNNKGRNETNFWGVGPGR
jgi:hypothetical protein